MKKVILTGIICSFIPCGTRHYRVLDNLGEECRKIVINKIAGGSIDLSPFIDSVTTIHLETNDQSIIQRISDIIIFDSLLMVCDPRTASLFFFDLQGNYHHKIAKRGRGPGEYSDITKVMVDEKNREIFIYDISTRRLFKYTLEGAFVSAIDYFCDGAVIRDMINLPNGNFLCYRNEKSEHKQDKSPTGLWEVDSSGKFLRYIIKEENVYPFITGEYPFYLYNLDNDVIGFCDQSTGITYHIGSGDISEYLAFTEIPGKRAMDFRGRSKVEEDFFVFTKQIEKGSFILSEWFGPENNYFITLFSKADNEYMTGRAMSSFFVENEFVPCVYGVRSNTPHIYVNQIPTMVTLSMIDHRDEMPEELQEGVKLILKNKTRDEVMEMNPIIQLLHLKY